MKLRASYLFFCLIIINSLFSQELNKKVSSQKPKLIVGIVVDQMRNDYIYRFWDRYGENGFKRLVNNGFYLKNAHYNYVPTFTGPGHSSIYTGTTPRTHGIIANEWFDKNSKQMNYCVDDKNVRSVGTNSKDGKKSPVNQLSSTIGDELKLSSSGKSKVFGIALKDRSAILPAGHAADAAYWFDDSTGNFITSTWYLDQLPKWMIDFNNVNYPKQYLEKGWSTLYPVESYTSSVSDDNKYERSSNGKKDPVFPYEYKEFIKKKNFAILKATPYGNTITKDLALACIKNESLGKDEFTDLLAISFSSPDIIAHSYGPRSVEIEDVYLRLDKEIDDLINKLDEEVGSDNYFIFLTADHGGADVPNYLIDKHIPAGYLTEEDVAKNVRSFLQKQYGDSGILLNCSNEQIFLDESKYNAKIKDDLEQSICDFLLTLNGISEAYSSKVIRNNSFPERDIRSLMQNGYNHFKSGNVLFSFKPAWMNYPDKGTTHGAGYSYDTHVPIIFYSKGIKSGSSTDYFTITQIIPTICELIKLNYPNGCVSNPIEKVLNEINKNEK